MDKGVGRCVVGASCAGRMLSSTPGLCPLEARGTPPPPVVETSADIAKWSLGAKSPPPPPVKKHWAGDPRKAES